MRLLLLGTLAGAATAAVHNCPLSHRFSYTSNGVDKCCDVNPTNGDCPGNSTNCTGSTCEDWIGYRRCPDTHPFVYRPVANRDYCCQSPDSNQANEINGNPNYYSRANNCKYSKYKRCERPPCSDNGRFGQAVPGNTGYLGCYNGDDDMTYVRSVGTIAECKSLAVDAGKPYFGLRNGTECLVGESYGASGKASETSCLTKCLGDSSFNCGGVTGISVYKTSTFVKVRCNIVNDDQTLDVYADGVRIPWVGDNTWDGMIKVNFPPTVKRLAIRTWDGQNYGLDSGGFAMSCMSDDTSSKWNLFGTTPYFLEYARGRSDVDVDTSRTIPIDWTNPNYDLNSAPAEWEFKPLWYKENSDMFDFLELGSDTLLDWPTINYNVKPQEYQQVSMMTFEPLDVHGSIVPLNEMSATLSSTYQQGYAYNCIDGLFTNKMCHSGDQGADLIDPFLTIDTGKERFFHSVTIYNREDVHAIRLGHHQIWISQTADFNSENTAFLCSEKTIDGYARQIQHRCPPNISGRFVHVKLPGNNRMLNLNEVVVSDLETEQKFEFRRYDNEDGRGASYLFQDTSIRDHHFEFTATVTTGAAPADHEAKLLSRGNCDSNFDVLNKDLITFKAGSFELKVDGMNTGTVLEPSTEYSIELERVNHEGADYLKLWVGDSMVYEAPTSMIDLVSNTPTKGINERNGKCNWAVGAGYCDAENSHELVNYQESRRSYSNAWDAAHTFSELNSERSWSAKNNGVDTMTIDQGVQKTVVGFTIQARADNGQYVKTLDMFASDDNLNWWPVKVPGQTSHAIQAWEGNNLSRSGRDITRTRYIKAVTARYIKIRPLTCEGHCSLRIGLNIVDSDWNAFNFDPFSGVVENAVLKLSQEAGTYNVKSLTAQPTNRPTIGNPEDIECSEANEIVFATYYKVVATNYHIPLDSQSNAIDFSARGPDAINMALLPAGVDPSDVSEGYTGGYEVFIGDSDEPYAHIGATFGGVPDAVVNLHDHKVIDTNEMRDYSVAINGSTVTIYYGHAHQSTKEVLLTHDFGTEKTVGYGLISYGYGDLECQENKSS